MDTQNKRERRRERREETYEYDGFDRLDAALTRREQLRQQEEALKNRTFNGYEINVKQIGKKDDIDKYWEAKMYAHREEIRAFYKLHPELGRAPNE